ncbi:MAG: hypothetical protein P8L20_01015 [Flavobacteriales bacterium]|nr:hypothetical protein [Flavobacteriales bacterium]
MKEAKLNKNRKPLSDEEVQKAENFDDVLSRLESPKENFFQKNWPYIASVLVLGIIGVFMLGGSDKKETIATEKKQFELITPINGLNILNTEHKLIAGEEGQIVTKTGTIIKYPKNAFLNASGNPVKGEIEILFREFHDVIEIFASGIPMEYDSASNKYHFESAGMFDIKGMQEGIPLTINPDFPLVVELSSKQHGDYFNLYKLDEKGKWNYIEKDTAKKVYTQQLDSIGLAQLPQRIKTLEKNAEKTLKAQKKADKSFNKLLRENNIYQPSKANNELYSIQLKSDKNEFPELVPFKNILFEITEDNVDFTPGLANKDWDDIQLKRKNKSEYLLIMFDDLKKHTFIVRPVISASNLEGANNVFDNLLSSYDDKLGGKLLSERTVRDSLKKVYKAISDSVNILNNFASRQAYEMSEIEKSTARIKRIFTIDSFGIFNSDCPQKLPKGAVFEPIFVNGKDRSDTLSFNHIYMAELNKNALFSLYGYWGKSKKQKSGEGSGADYITQEISFNPYNKTVIWGITLDNRLAVIKPNKMSLLKKGGNGDVEMFVSSNEINDLDKLRKLLGFA